MKRPDFDAIIVKRVAQANKTMIGRLLNSLSSRIGGVLVLALLNIICTAILGAMVIYLAYHAGGVYAALPAILVTTIPIAVIFVTMVNHKLGVFGAKKPRKLLLLAIFFSLPFGILSLPLLHRMSSAHSKKLNKTSKRTV